MGSLQVGGFIPDMDVRSTAAPQTTIVVTLHSATCGACIDYVNQIASASSEFDVWDGRLVIAVLHDSESLRLQFGTVWSDTKGLLASNDAARVIVADRYGQIFYVCDAAEGHAFPSVRQLEEWLKFLGTLCPE
jgi:hypothetical protein